MTTDELKTAAELWRLGRETPTQERIELVRQLAGVVGDAATERKFRQASNMLADWAVERLITEPQQYEYIATLERERDESRAAYLALRDSIEFDLDHIGRRRSASLYIGSTLQAYPDKPEWRKGDA